MCHWAALHFPASREVWKAASGTRGGEVRPRGPRAGPAGRAALDGALSSPTALPAIFPLWTSFSFVQQVFVAPGAGRARRGGCGLRRPSPCPQSASRRPLAHAFVFSFKSHGGEGQGTKWEGMISNHQPGPLQEGNQPQVYLQASQSFVSLGGCTLTTAHSRPLISENSGFHKFHV